MKRTVTISISAEDIAAATPENSSHCMIADGLKRQMPHISHVSVDVQSIRFSDPTTRLRYTYLTPTSVQDALVNFDLGTKPKPFSFRLNRSTSIVTPMAGKREPARLVPVNEKSKTQRSVPVRVGGKPPRRTAPDFRTGRIRAFGLRGMG